MSRSQAPICHVANTKELKEMLSDKLSSKILVLKGCLELFKKMNDQIRIMFTFFFQLLPVICSWRVNQKRIWSGYLIPWHDQIAVWGIFFLLTWFQVVSASIPGRLPHTFVLLHMFQCCHTLPSSTYTSVLSNPPPPVFFFPWHFYFFFALSLSTTTFILELTFNHFSSFCSTSIL